MLLFQLFSFQTCQSAQTHVHDCLGLYIIETESLDQACLCSCNIRTFSDYFYNFINIVECDQQSLQDMVPFLSFVEVIAGPAGDNVLLMTQIVHQHLQEIHDLGLVVDQSQHGNSESILHLRMLEKTIEDDIWISVMAKFDDDPHAFSVGLIAEICNTLDPLGLDQLRDLLDQICLVDKIRKLRNHNAVLAV